MTDSQILAELRRCTAAAGERGQPQPLYRAIDDSVQRLVGHKLFTLLVVDGDEVARVYSSNPTAYPVSGRKPMNRTAWGDLVMKQHKTFIGRGPDDIRRAFFDHQLIFSLGLGSVVNTPVVYDDRTIGTFAVLHEAGWFDEAKAEIIAAFAPLVIGPFLKGV
jgi:hypothetical protein